MPKYLVWDAKGKHSVTLKAQHFVAAVSEAKEWAAHCEWGLRVKRIILHIGMMNVDGDVPCVEQVPINVGPESTKNELELKKLRRIVGHVVHFCQFIDDARSDDGEPNEMCGPNWAKVGNMCSLGSTDAIALCKEYDVNPHYDCGEDPDSLVLLPRGAKYKRRHEAVVKAIREGYIGPRYVFDVKDDRFRHLIVARTVNEALGLCNLYTGQILIRTVPWDKEIATLGLEGTMKTAQQWAHTTKVGIFLSESLPSKES